METSHFWKTKGRRSSVSEAVSVWVSYCLSNDMSHLMVGDSTVAIYVETERVVCKKKGPRRCRNIVSNYGYENLKEFLCQSNFDLFIK